MRDDVLATLRRRSGVVRFLRFAGLSGLGWILDFGLLLTFVHLLSIPASTANVVSSCVAALTVFLVSRLLVFETASHYLLVRIVIYVSYVLLVIFVASFAISALVPWLLPLLVHRLPDAWLLTAAAAIAKVIVTPPQLLLNFVVARYLSERDASTELNHA